MMRRRALFVVALVAATLVVVPAIASLHDPVISSNEPLPYPKNGQNEPSLALDRVWNKRRPRLIAGGNDYVDQIECSAPSCGFKETIGISGVYYSDNGSAWRSWSSPRPAGATAGPTAIKTLPNFSTNRWSFGDPALGAGPRPAIGVFAWSLGTRFYYATLAAEANSRRVITVSYSDPKVPARLVAPVWSEPHAVSTGAVRADKPAIWADDASSSHNFGHVYVCWTEFLGDEDAGGRIMFSRSLDGGVNWAPPRRLTKVLAAQGCTIRSDAAGRVYVFWRERSPRPKDIGSRSGTSCSGIFKSRIFMAKSANGLTFSVPLPVATVPEPGRWDATQLQCTVDGVTGARVNSFASVDIANGAPKGGGTNMVALATSEGPNGDVMIRFSRNLGGSWTRPVRASRPTGGAAFPAVALAPAGDRIFLVYTAFLQGWQSDVAAPRRMRAVVRTGPVSTAGSVKVSAEVDGAVGDARASANFEGGDAAADPLRAEFLGDYDAIVATNDGAWAAWTDVSAAAVCVGVNMYRDGVAKGGHPEFPTVKSCPQPPVKGTRLLKSFGNTTLCGIYVPAVVPSGTQETECAIDPHP